MGFVCPSRARTTTYRRQDGASRGAHGLQVRGHLDLTHLSPVQGIGSQLLPKNVWVNPSWWPLRPVEKGTATDVSAVMPSCTRALGLLGWLESVHGANSA